MNDMIHCFVSFVSRVTPDHLVSPVSLVLLESPEREETEETLAMMDNLESL